MNNSITISTIVPVIVALIAAIASLIVTGINFFSTKKNTEDLEFLKAGLVEQQAENKALRDYQYEARRRLYKEYEPLLFQLVELSETALHRINGFAQEAREGRLEPGPWGLLSLNSYYSDYYLVSTMYRLISPLAIYKIMRRRLTLFDITVDSLIDYQYRLAKCLYLSFSDDFDFSRREPHIEYDPFSHEWRKEREDNPAKYRRQGILGGLLDNAVETMIVREPDGLLRPMSFGEFNTAYQQADSEVHKNFALVSDIFVDFHPRDRPVLWRMLVTQAYIYMSFIHIDEIKPARTDGSGMPGKAMPSTRQWKSISDVERRHKYDWRQPSEKGTRSDDEVLHQPFAGAQTYLQGKLGVTFLSRE